MLANGNIAKPDADMTRNEPNLMAGNLNSAHDVVHNLLFNYCNFLFLVFLCNFRYFRFR